MNSSRSISLGQNRAAHVLLIVCVCFFTISAYYWMDTNTAPPSWDQSWYLETSERLWSALYQGGFSAFFEVLSHAFSGTKAPLISLLPLPFYLLVGHGKLAVNLTSIVLIVLFCVVLFYLVRELAGPWEALVAVFITNTMPLTIGLSRLFLVEYGLMTLVTLWMLLQWRSNHFRQCKIALGITLGLGMLMKVSFPLFIGGPALLGLYRRWREEGVKLKDWTFDLGLIMVIGGLVASVWYLPNALRVAKFAFSAGFGVLSLDYSYGTPLAWETLERYWKAVINLGFSTYYTMLLIVGTLVLCIGIMVKRWRSGAQASFFFAKSSGLGLLLLWFSLPLIVLSLGINKDYRFLLPTFPALGIMLALVLFRALPWPRVQAIILPVMLLLPLALFVYITFPVFGNVYWADRHWIVMSANLGYAARPVQERWPHIEIIQAVLADAYKNDPPPGPSYKPRTLLIVDHRFFNQNNFSYYAAHMNLPLIFSAVNTRSAEDWPSRRAYLLQSQYALTKESGEQGPPFNTFMNTEIRKMLATGELPFVEVARFQLPDGSESILYRRLEKTSP